MTEQATAPALPPEVVIAEAHALEIYLRQRCQALGSALLAAQAEVQRLTNQVIALQAENAGLKEQVDSLKDWTDEGGA